MTQDELAKKLGVGRSTVGMYEAGKREPDFEMLEAIADIFNVSMSALVDKDTAPAQSMGEILEESELELVEKYRQLTELNKGRVLQQIDTLLDAQSKATAKSINSVG